MLENVIIILVYRQGDESLFDIGFYVIVEIAVAVIMVLCINFYK